MDNLERLADLLRFANEAKVIGHELDVDDLNDLADFLDINDVVVQRWISVEERLPERGTWVLCCGAKGGLFLSDWLIPHNINTNDNTVYCSVPNARSGRYAKYWMPLPEPPKEE